MKAQPPHSRWTEEEIDFLLKSIRAGKTLDEIMKVISRRKMFAILDKAYKCGYGYYFDKIDGRCHFKNGNKQIPTKIVDTADNEDGNSISKTDINVNHLHEIDDLKDQIIDLLGQVINLSKENIALHKTIKKQSWEP